MCSMAAEEAPRPEGATRLLLEVGASAGSLLGRRRFPLRSTRELRKPDRERRDTVHVPLTQPMAKPATSATRSMSHTIWQREGEEKG